jgi:hypothetical protein
VVKEERGRELRRGAQARKRGATCDRVGAWGPCYGEVEV